MSDLSKPLAELWMSFGDVFHDLAHSCYQRAVRLGTETQNEQRTWYRHPNPTQVFRDFDTEGTDDMGVVMDDD